MKTAEDRLRFVVEFAGMELDQLNLKDDLQTFFGGGRHGEGTLASFAGALVMPLQVPLPQDYTEDHFRKLQQDVRQLLHDMVGNRDLSVQNTSTPIPMQVEFSVQPWDDLGFPGRNVLAVRGSTRDCLLWLLSHLLAQEPTGRIVRCPSCETIFYRDRANQEYCTRRCVNRVNKRSWRAGKRQSV
jgi:hypothetical protein